MNAGDVSRFLGLPSSTLHRWIKQGLIGAAGGGASGRAYDFGFSDIVRVVIIMSLKELKATNASIRSLCGLLADSDFEPQSPEDMGTVLLVTPTAVVGCRLHGGDSLRVWVPGGGSDLISTDTLWGDWHVFLNDPASVRGSMQEIQFENYIEYAQSRLSAELPDDIPISEAVELGKRLKFARLRLGRWTPEGSVFLRECEAAAVALWYSSARKRPVKMMRELVRRAREQLAAYEEWQSGKRLSGGAASGKAAKDS